MLTSALAATVVFAGPLPTGSSKVTVDVKGTPIEVFTYKPDSYREGPLIVVFHGTLRNADEYRDDAREMAERFKALVIAPKFDAERFPNWRYHRGGVVRPDGTLAPREAWTYAMVPKIVDAIRRQEGRPGMPFSYIGHSAGGQFLIRMAAFYPTKAERIVVANAGSFLFPRTDWPFGYGFGKLPADLPTEPLVRSFLAQPVTLYLGTADNGPDEYLDTSPEAMLQGPGRFQRNQAGFAYAKRLAKEKGWPFRWNVVTVPGIGHDHLKMFNAPPARFALFGDWFWQPDRG